MCLKTYNNTITSFQENTNITFQAECLSQFWQIQRAILLPTIYYVNLQHDYVHIRLIYVNTQLNSPSHGWNIADTAYNQTIPMSTCEIINMLTCDLISVLYVIIIILHVGIKKSHRNIIILHVDINYLACRGQKYSNLQFRHL